MLLVAFRLAVHVKFDGLSCYFLKYKEDLLWIFYVLTPENEVTDNSCSIKLYSIYRSSVHLLLIENSYLLLLIYQFLVLRRQHE